MILPDCFWYFYAHIFFILQVEISHLKARQGGLQEEIQKLQHSAQSASVSASLLPVTTTSSTTSSSSTFLSRPIGSHQGFHGDEMDLSDVLWSQQQINRLSAEVTRLEAEVAHWRRMSQVFGRKDLGAPETSVCSAGWVRSAPYTQNRLLICYRHQAQELVMVTRVRSSNFKEQ